MGDEVDRARARPADAALRPETQREFEAGRAYAAALRERGPAIAAAKAALLARSRQAAECVLRRGRR